MIRLISVIAFFLCVSGCISESSDSGIEIINAYYEGFNASNFEHIETVLADSITLIEGEYTVPFSMDAFYTQFQWDSVFATQHEIIDIRAEENQVIATVSSTSDRYAFLENNPYTCVNKFTLASGKISSIEVEECPQEDRNIWEARRDTLVAWIDNNHPELSGFIHDLTPSGAEKYMKAIHLYENQHP